MRGMNVISVVGRLGQDPELLTAKNGNVWMKASIATNRVAKKDEQWVEETDWHRVHIFGKAAERVNDIGKAGTLIGVTGTMTYDKWTDEEGVRRMTARILADRVELMTNFKDREPAEA